MSNETVDSSKVDALQVIKGLCHGEVAYDLSDELQKVVAKVIETKNDGSVTLVLKIAPEKIGNNSIRITAAVNAKLPKPDAKSDIRFGTEDGVILKDDPAQKQFEFMKDFDKKPAGKE